MTAPFPRIEKAVRALIIDLMPDSAGRVGGDLSYTAGDPFYVWLAIVGGRSDSIYGQWVLDIDVFDSNYAEAMDRCLALEALLLRPGGHVAEFMRIDRVDQNESPTNRPWDDESVYRVGATYTFNARRSG